MELGGDRARAGTPATAISAAARALYVTVREKENRAVATLHPCFTLLAVGLSANNAANQTCGIQ